VAVVAAAVCVRLGLWQLSRLHQRRARNAAVRAALAKPAVELSGRVQPESLINRRVHARGVYDYAHEQFWRPRTLDDMPGVDLVTPLKLADGSAVLVDRGFAQSPDAYHVNQALYREPDTADVVGIALSAPRSRGDVDPRLLADSLPYRLLPFVVQELQSAELPIGAPHRLPPPELSDGPHLSYTIQWFSFAIVILAGTATLLRKERQERGA